MRKNKVVFVLFISFCAVLILTCNGWSIGNDIRSFRVISQTSNRLVLDVHYSYSGTFGPNVWIGAKMAEDGKPSQYYSHVPGKLSKGSHNTKVVLKTNPKAPKAFKTNQIIFTMYIGGKYTFLEEIFLFSKVWSSKAGANRPPVRQPNIQRKLISAPKQLSPGNGAKFSHYPRTNTFAWKPVPGAKSYTIEIDCMHCCKAGKWCSDLGKSWRVKTNLKSTNFTDTFVGAQPGRWRVWAVGAGGVKGIKSPWYTFSFTQ